MKNSQTHRIQFILPGREDQYLNETMIEVCIRKRCLSR